jgi:hypothetical protein
VKADVGSLVAGSVEAGWSFLGAAETPGVRSTTVQKLVVKGANAGAFTAAEIFAATIEGDFSGMLTVTNDAVGSPSLRDFSAATVTGGKINASGWVGNILAQQWTGGSITAKRLDSIEIKGGKNLPGNFNGAIVAVTGTDGGAIRVNGSLGGTTINGPNAAFLSIVADEWVGGDLTAQSLRFFRLLGDPARSVAGDLLNAHIRMDNPNTSVAEFVVKGFIRNATIQSFGDVGLVEVLGLESATISIAGQHRLDTLNLTGTNAATKYFIGSHVNAGIIGSVVVQNVDPAFGGNEFGITADRIEKYVRFEGREEVAPPLTNLDTPGTFDPEGDYRVTIT